MISDLLYRLVGSCCHLKGVKKHQSSIVHKLMKVRWTWWHLGRSSWEIYHYV